MMTRLIKIWLFVQTFWHSLFHLAHFSVNGGWESRMKPPEALEAFGHHHSLPG